MAAASIQLLITMMFSVLGDCCSVDTDSVYSVETCPSSKRLGCKDTAFLRGPETWADDSKRLEGMLPVALPVFYSSSPVQDSPHLYSWNGVGTEVGLWLNFWTSTEQLSNISSVQEPGFPNDPGSPICPSAQFLIAYSYLIVMCGWNISALILSKLVVNYM